VSPARHAPGAGSGRAGNPQKNLGPRASSRPQRVRPAEHGRWRRTIAADCRGLPAGLPSDGGDHGGGESVPCLGSRPAAGSAALGGRAGSPFFPRGTNSSPREERPAAVAGRFLLSPASSKKPPPGGFLADDGCRPYLSHLPPAPSGARCSNQFWTPAPRADNGWTRAKRRSPADDPKARSAAAAVNRCGRDPVPGNAAEPGWPGPSPPPMMAPGHLVQGSQYRTGSFPRVWQGPPEKGRLVPANWSRATRQSSPAGGHRRALFLKNPRPESA
jgi:hypothetical protein